MTEATQQDFFLQQSVGIFGGVYTLLTQIRKAA